MLQGRLQDGDKPTDEDIRKNINIVMETIRTDPVDPETGRHQFDPTLMKRADIRPKKNVYLVEIQNSSSKA